MSYSLSALFALPRSFAGLFFASKAIHVSSPSPPVVKYTPTRTTEIFLEPTRCLPSPIPIGPSELPYVVMYGLAAVLIASFVYTIWSTFAHRRSPTLPAAPPEPDPETTPDEFDTWPPWLMFLYSNIAFHLSSTVTTIRAPAIESLFPELMLYRLAMVLEERFLDVLSLFNHLHDHGLQYLKIVLLAIVGHSLGLLIFFAYQRARKWVRAHSTSPVHWHPYSWTLPCGTIILGLSSESNWIPWLYYYILVRYTPLLSPQDIRDSIIQSFSAGTLPTILGPLAFALGSIALQTAVDILTQFLSLVGVLVQLQMRRKLRASYISKWLLHACLSALLEVYGPSVAVFIFLEVSTTDSFLGPAEQQLLDQPVAFHLIPSTIWDIIRVSRIGHHTWRTTQAQAFREICCTFVTASQALNWVQKLIIIAPAVVIYGYLYIMPIVRKIHIRMKLEYWKYRRRRAMDRQYHLNYTVENRLAANN